MKNYGTETMGNLAASKPVNTNFADMDVVALIKKAQASRNEHMSSWISNAIEGFKEKREASAAKATLYSMTDRELRDIGLTRGEIDQAVDGTLSVAAEPRVGFWKTLGIRFIEAQKARAAYIQLSAMNARELADIGLTRTEIEAAVTGKLQLRANDNLVEAAHLNGHRKAS